MLYYAVFLFSGMLFSTYKQKNEVVRRIGVALSVIVPSIMAGARYRVGTDWDNYNYNMTLMRTISFHEVFHHRLLSNGEFGYKLIVKLLSYLFSNEVIFGLIALATLGFIANALIQEYKEYQITIAYIMFLFIYFGNSFNLMRQTLAAAIIFWGMKYIFRNDFIHYYITVFCAFLIHFTALFAIPLFYIWNKKERKALNIKQYLPVIGLFSIFVLLWRVILRIALGYGNAFIGKFAIYLSDNEGKNRDFYLKGIIFLFLLIMFFYTSMRSEKIKMFLQMGLLNIIIGTTGFYITFFKRLGIYYEMPVIILIAALSKGFRKESRIIVNIISCMVVMAYFALLYYFIGDSKIIPYTPITLNKGIE